MRLFHLIAPQAWVAAQKTGHYHPPSLDTEGFVHFSFAAQVEGTANLLYEDVPELEVIEFDSGLLGGLEVRVEPAPRSTQTFPHVYGPIPVTAAVARHPIARDREGVWRVSFGDEDAAASPDR